MSIEGPTTPPATPPSNDAAVVRRPGEQLVMGVSLVQWRSLALVVERADGQAVTYVVHGTPNGDAAIETRTADALHRRGLVRLSADMAAPTDRGRRALRIYRQRIARQRAESTKRGDQ